MSPPWFIALCLAALALALYCGGCAPIGHDLQSSSAPLAERPETLVLFVDSDGIWDGSKAGQVYKLLDGCEYAEWTDGDVNVNTLAPATEPPTCPETVTIHGEVATGPVMTSANAGDGMRVWTCTYPAPNVSVTGDEP